LKDLRFLANENICLVILAHFYYLIAECDKNNPKKFIIKSVFLDRIVENREITDFHWTRPKIKRMSNGNNHFMAFQETAAVTFSLLFRYLR